MVVKASFAAIVCGALLASPALAQNSNGQFVKDQSMNQWRVSKLVGVKVVGPDQKSVGFIDDVLMDHDGNAQTIVIGVGGFLGIGKKDVGVPFKAVQWRTEGRTVAVAGPPQNSTGSAANNSMGSSGANAPAAVMAKTDPAATEASQGYPDMAMLDMTKEQLKSAPDFHYAAAPTVESAATTPPSQHDPNAAAPK